jgi:hypothetical protein
LDPNGLKINILYNVSDFIKPSMVNYKVSNWDCNVTVEEWFVPSLITPGPNFIQGDGTGDGVIEVEINVDPDSFENAGADKASYWQQDEQERYQVKFCLFVGVQTDESVPMIVDSSETQISVTYDLTDGFVLSLEVTPVRRNETADDAYKPEGFFCNEQGERLSEDEKFGLRFPGTELRVCVRPDQRARDQGMGLEKINEFAWVRTDDNGMTVEQLCILDGQVVGGLTVMQCDDYRCEFVSLLQAGFFNAALPTPAPSVAPVSPGSSGSSGSNLFPPTPSPSAPPSSQDALPSSPPSAAGPAPTGRTRKLRAGCSHVASEPSPSVGGSIAKSYPSLVFQPQSLPDHQSDTSRTLQLNQRSITGIGVATVKFVSTRYRRNLLTGEEVWEEFEDLRQRRLQVGGESAFNMELDVILGLPRERVSSSLPRAQVTLGIALSSFMAVLWSIVV